MWRMFLLIEIFVTFFLEDSILLSILEKEFHMKIQDETMRFFGKKKKLRGI